jgi:hypothetical protein
MSGKSGARRNVAKQALLLAVATFVLSSAALAGLQGAAAFRSRSCAVVNWEPRAVLPWLVVAALPCVLYAVVVAYAMKRRLPPVTLGEGPYRQSVLDEPTRVDRPRSHLYVRGLLVVLALGAGVAEGRRWSCPYAVPASCRPKKARIAIMPVGTVDRRVVAEVSAHFRDCYGLPVSTLDGRPLPSEAWNAKREQWSAEALLAAIPSCEDGDPLCESDALIIGVTSEDIYTTKESWRYAFTMRDSARHVAILSTSRMGSTANVRKMVAKTIALEYCGLSQSSNTKSVRYNGILGPDNLEAIDESVW